MKWTRTDDGDDTKLEVSGALDALSATEIRPVFDRVVADGKKRVVVHVADVTLIDSPGVGTLVSLCKRIEATGGHFAISGARDQPLSVFKLLKLDRLLV